MFLAIFDKYQNSSATFIFREQKTNHLFKRIKEGRVYYTNLSTKPFKE